MYRPPLTSGYVVKQLVLLVLVIVAGWYIYTTQILHTSVVPGNFSIGSASTVSNSTAPIVITSGQHDVRGLPSLTGAQMDAILCGYGSPACGKGNDLYADGVKYNINSVYAMAFFWHESNFGTQGMARITYSLGNLRCIDGYACVNQSGDTCQIGQSCYASFGSWPVGFNAWFVLIKDLYINTWDRTTIETIIPKYAPSADGNDESAYINNVLASVSSYIQRSKRGSK